VLTPTYHVFNMYKVHQDAELLALNIETSEYKCEDESIPQVTATASVDSEGKIHISLCNLSPNEVADVKCDIRGSKKTKVTGTILVSDEMNAHNTFEEKGKVVLKPFDRAAIQNDELIVSLPAMSVVTLEIK